MCDVQANGEPKKIFLNKLVENPPVTNQPATSSLLFKTLRSSTGDQVRIPPRRYMPPVDKNVEEHLSNHKKQRYWNSWEEFYLVELWRRYKDEVSSVNVPLPVYRKMMIAMRNRNMIVTAQDCRRKINTINTRYKQEILRMESTGCRSEWRLFPLVHCVLQPKIKEFDPWIQYTIIKKLMDKVPKPVVEVPQPVCNNINNNYQTPQAQNTPTIISSNQAPLPAGILTSGVYTKASPYNKLSSSRRRFEKMSILPFRNITIEKIEYLRQDNNRLAEQRDEDLKRLQMEEENFRCFEEFIRAWTEQKEIELQRIQLMSVQSTSNIENEGNQNFELQIQETVIAK